MPIAKRKASAEVQQSSEALTTAVTKGASAWVDAQSEFLADVESAAKSWLKRRREAFDSMRQSLENLRGCRDFADALLIQQSWISGSLQRVTSDLGDFNTLAMNALERSGRKALQATQSAAETSSAIGER